MYFCGGFLLSSNVNHTLCRIFKSQWCSLQKFLNIIYVWCCYYYYCGYFAIISVQYQIINYCQHKAVIISFCSAQPQLMPGHSHTQAFLRLLASWHLVGFVMCRNIPWHLILCSAYMCHHNTFLLYSAMKEKTEMAWSKATHVSVSISCVVIMMCAVAGYVTFTGFTQGKFVFLWDECWLFDQVTCWRIIAGMTRLWTSPGCSSALSSSSPTLSNVLFVGKSLITYSGKTIR